MNDDDKVYAITTTISSNGVGVGPYDTYASNITASSSVPFKEYAIKGEMLVASHSYNADLIDQVGRDEIKRQLALQLASEMLASKYIEFTQMKDRITGETIVKARAFVTNDGHVKILRTNGY